MTIPRTDTVSRRTALAGLGASGLGLALAARGAAAWDTTPAGGQTMASASDHYTLADDDAEAIWFIGTLALIKGVGSQTGGALAIVEFLHPPDFATTLHVHHTADEAFYVLAGAMRGVCGDQEWQATTGGRSFGFRAALPTAPPSTATSRCGPW
jgi:mannose-6-phosphate isomerase-like protein (cupin superfamily)